MRASSMRWQWHRLLAICALLVLSIHLFHVLQWNQPLLENRTPTPNPKKTKFDHLVHGPPAGFGLPDRLQCEGWRALNKTHPLPSANQSSVDGFGISFVTVFTVYNSTSRGTVTIGNASLTRNEVATSILNIFLNFIEVTMPQSNAFILTDPLSNFALLRNRVTVIPIQGEYSRDKLMLQRIKSYIGFLEKVNPNEDHSQHYIFTDSDISVVGDLANLFKNESDFDIALTFRNNKDQPLNSGFIAVRGTQNSIAMATEFLNEVLAVYSSKFLKSSRMLGDQLSLAWVVKSHIDSKQFSKSEAFVGKVGRTKVLFLPCLVYNWTPPEGAGQFHGMPLNVKVVHFKGSRKRLMMESWKFFKSSKSIDDMLCLVLTSGRTKYDF